MIISALLQKAAARSMAVALATSAVALVPQLQAQAPAPPVPAPVTAGDAKDFEAADALFKEQKWAEAQKAFIEFQAKYKGLSPRSIEAKFRLAICYLQTKGYLEAVRELKALLADPKFDPAGKEQAQLLVAKAYTLHGAEMPGGGDAQKGAQAKVFEDAIKEYDTFLQTYPQSKSGDTAHFLRATLLMNIERWDDAVKGFSVVYQRYQQSPLRMQALMNIGKTFMAQGYSLLSAKGGKEPEKAQVQQALTIFEKNALPSLAAAYTQSGDLAIMNEATYYIGQIQLSRSQNADATTEEGKKAQVGLLDAALDAFRAVRSREEVIQAQEQKIAGLRRAIQLLPVGTADYLPSKNYYDNLVDLEEEKKAKFLAEQDQFLGARLAIARIFLFLKKPDECRALLRYLQRQKEVLEKEKDAQATIASLLCLTYIEQKNLPKAQESYDAFRSTFKSHTDGDNLPLLMANAYLESGDPVKAEEMVAQGEADYNPWRFQTEANQILIAANLGRGQLDKAAELVEKMLASNPKPEVEVEALFLKGIVEKTKAAQNADSKLAQQAILTFQALRDKYKDGARAEDAWFEQCSILAGLDPGKALTELPKYIGQFGNGTGKSPNTKNNVPIAQFRLGQVLDATGKKDEAIKAYETLYTKWPESEASPGAYFKVFDIYHERRDYANCRKMMEEFIAKYPEHANVYFAFNNVAEILFSGVLNAKPGPDGKPGTPGASTVADIEAGAKKLYEYVDYELSKDLKVKKGDSALLNIANRWGKELSRLPSYVIQSNDQKVTWQKAIEGITAAVEKMLQSYPQGEKLPQGLEQLVTAQTAMLRAQVIDVGKGSAYFQKLAEQTTDGHVKAKILFAGSAFVQDADPKKAADLRNQAIALAGEPMKVASADGKTEDIVPTFTPSDYDRYLKDLFEAKKFDDMSKVIERIRKEFPIAKDEDPSKASMVIQNAQSVALFWEAKILGEQGKAVDAGNLFTKLSKDYPKSTKVLEADYGIILGNVEQGKFTDETFIPRLTKVVTNVRDQKTFELPAKALFLIGRIHEAQKDYDAAVASYRKTYTSYAVVADVAGDALWKAGEILEKQAKGALPVRTQEEVKAIAADRAAKAKARREAEAKKAEAEKSKTPPKGSDGKPNEKGPAKPEVAKAAAAAVQK